MTPEQKARVISELLDLREAARIEYVRYLRQYQALDLAIKLNLTVHVRNDHQKLQGTNPQVIIVDEMFITSINTRNNVNKKRKKEVDK